jgi:tetratricopeptide (TPR) repeat protein
MIGEGFARNVHDVTRAKRSAALAVAIAVVFGIAWAGPSGSAVIATPAGAKTTKASPPGEVAKSTTPPIGATIMDARKLYRDGSISSAALLLGKARERSSSDAEKNLIDDELKRLQLERQQLLELEAIESLIDIGRQKEAANHLAALAPVIANERVARRLEAVARQLDLSDQWPLWTIWDWLVAASPYLIIVAAILGLRALFRWLWPTKVRWRLTAIVDKTDRGAKELIAHYFSEWISAGPESIASGLLMMEATAVPSYPELSLDDAKFDLDPDLEKVDLTIAGINVSSALRVLPAISRWWFPQPIAISGVAYVDDAGRVCARLTTRRSFAPTDRGALAVSAVTEGSDENAVRLVAKEVTFKMLYALSPHGPGGGATANELRKGLGLLKGYLEGTVHDKITPWAQLERARSVFEEVRAARPESLEAHLYEGIALDLLERHEDAAAHFDHVKEQTEGETDRQLQIWHDQSIYNGAVAHLRNLYELAGIDQAIERLTEFVKPANGDPNFLAARPILALATATLADAWGNRTIHWRELLTDPKFAGATSEESLTKVIGHHQSEIEKLIEAATKARAIGEQSLLQAVPPASASAPAPTATPGRGMTGAGATGGVPPATPAGTAPSVKGQWDKALLRQLEWAINNAWADHHLYSAAALAKLDANGGGFASQPVSLTAADDHKKKAIGFLRQCEMLLPPGVETLSNLGTLYLLQAGEQDLPQARRYLRRAIKLNPRYEYAYYRLARSWEIEGWRDRVIEVLKSCPVPPGITEFRAMFERYYVQPATDYPDEG